MHTHMYIRLKDMFLCPQEPEIPLPSFEPTGARLFDRRIAASNRCTSDNLHIWSHRTKDIQPPPLPGTNLLLYQISQHPCSKEKKKANKNTQQTLTSIDIHRDVWYLRSTSFSKLMLTL